MNPSTLFPFAGRAMTLALVCACLACNTASKGAPAPNASALSAQDESSAPEAQGSDPEAIEPEAPPLMPFGVPECDNFVKKYVACVEGRVPADQKAQLMEALQQNRARWRELATMQQAAVALSLACRTVARQSKGDLMVDYGCEF